MGLNGLGSGNEDVANEMIAYANDTQHEKIIRGLGMGLALILYGHQKDADFMIDGMV